MASGVVMEGEADIAEYESLLRSVTYSMSQFTCPKTRELQVSVYSGIRCATICVHVLLYVDRLKLSSRCNK